MTWVTQKTWAALEVPGAAGLNTYLRDAINSLQLGLNGDTSGDTETEHAHRSTTLANMPAAGKAGRLCFTTDLKEVWIDDGTKWRVLSRDVKDVDYFFEEFILDASTGDNWREILQTGSSTFGPLDATGSFHELATGTTINSELVVAARLSTLTGHYQVTASQTPAILVCKFRTSTSLQQRLMIGLMQNTAAGDNDPEDGIYFRRRETTVGTNVFLVCRKNNTESTFDMGADASATAAFEARILSTTSVKGYRNDTYIGEITTNIPDDIDICLAMKVYNLAAASKTLRPDFIEFRAPRL